MVRNGKRLFLFFHIFKNRHFFRTGRTVLRLCIYIFIYDRFCLKSIPGLCLYFVLFRPFDFIRSIVIAGVFVFIGKIRERRIFFLRYERSRIFRNFVLFRNIVEHAGERVVLFGAASLRRMRLHRFISLCRRRSFFQRCKTVRIFRYGFGCSRFVVIACAFIPVVRISVCIRFIRNRCVFF